MTLKEIDNMAAIIAALPGTIQKLLSDRQMHLDALAAIDDTLAKVGSALGASGGVGPRRGRPPKNTTAAPAGASPAPSASSGGGKKRRKRGKFSVSGDESILTFLQAQKDATTSDIAKHWASEGRGGKPDNALSKLVKEKKLKRTPLGEGIRGSTYAVA